MVAQIGTSISTAIEWLDKGQCVGIPTETVYGLAANAWDETAVSKIFLAKNRPHFDPLIVHTNSIGRIEDQIAHLTPAAERLLEKFSPGPLTVILPKKSKIPYLVTSGMETVGVRIPAHSLAQELLGKLKFPLAAPSANPFGYISPTTAQHVFDQLAHAIPYILDGGPSAVGVESTIVDCSLQEPVVLRLGGLELESLFSALGREIAVKTSSSNPTAPGMLESHYAPGCPIEILAEPTLDVPPGTGFLGFQTPQKASLYQEIRLLPLSSSMAEAARLFFKYLRELDQLGLSKIHAEYAPDRNLGRAINDRLQRAAAKR